jgi:zinc protease
LYIVWHSAALFEAGDAELDLVADLMGNGRTSRLYKRLIHDRRIAVELAAAQTSRELGGTFQIVATAAPGQSLDDLQTAIFDEIDRFVDAGPTPDELRRGHTQAETAFVMRLQSLGGFGGKADQLNAYNIYQGEPDGFDRDLNRYLSASGPELASTAALWLGRERAVSLGVVPDGHRDLGLSEAEPAMGLVLA